MSYNKLYHMKGNKMKKHKLAKIKKINHGKAFGNENWYTFYCGNCNRQVLKESLECNKCGFKLEG